MVLQKAEKFLGDFFRSNLCLFFPPNLLAAASIYMSGELLKVDLQSAKILGEGKMDKDVSTTITQQASNFETFPISQTQNQKVDQDSQPNQSKNDSLTIINPNKLNKPKITTDGEADCFDLFHDKDHPINNTNQNDSFFSFPTNQINHHKEKSFESQKDNTDKLPEAQNVQAIFTNDNTQTATKTDTNLITILQNNDSKSNQSAKIKQSDLKRQNPDAIDGDHLKFYSVQGIHQPQNGLGLEIDTEMTQELDNGTKNVFVEQESTVTNKKIMDNSYNEKKLDGNHSENSDHASDRIREEKLVPQENIDANTGQFGDLSQKIHINFLDGSDPPANASPIQKEAQLENELDFCGSEKPRTGSGEGGGFEIYDKNNFGTEVNSKKPPGALIFINIRTEEDTQSTLNLDKQNLDVLVKPGNSQLQTDFDVQKREYKKLKVFCRSPDIQHNISGMPTLENSKSGLEDNIKRNTLPDSISGIAEEKISGFEPDTQIFDNKPWINNNATTDNCSMLSSDTNLVWYKIFGTDVTLDKLKKITQQLYQYLKLSKE